MYDQRLQVYLLYNIRQDIKMMIPHNAIYHI